MEHRESILPLIASLALALGVHVAALAGYAIIEAAPADRTVEPARPAPDLAVSDLFTDEPRVAGQPTSITTTIRNAGDLAAEAFDIELFVDEQSVARFTRHEELAPGAAFDQAFVHTVAEPGLHRVRVVVDPAGTVDESNESNNRLDDAFVWLAQDGGSQAGKTDLAVATFTVPEPRIAGEPTRIIGRIANLGRATDGPVGLGVLVDGELVGTAKTAGPIGAGRVVEFQMPLLVEKSGDRDITLIADPARAIDDADLTNNRLTRTIRFEPPDEKVKIGQLEKSPVDINWISMEDYQDLLARKQRFDQATSQRLVDPVEGAPTPRDPTPPAPKPSPNPSRPQPSAPVAVVTPSAPSAVVKPSPSPEQPKQPDDPIDPSDTEPRQAPPMKEPTPDSEAAAPKQADPIEPVKIDPTKVLDNLPNPVTDAKPNPPSVEPTPAPPDTGDPSRRIALLTPPIKLDPGSEPVLPDFTPRTDKPDDAAIRKAPDKDPDHDADPADKSARVDAKKPGDAVASLPLDPKPDTRPASPSDQPTDKPDPDRQMKRPDKPVQPDEPTDGAKPKPDQKPTATVKPSPANPAASPNESRPTSAPRTDRESDPVTRIEALTVRPGKVVARNGLKINTVQARFSAVARGSSAPANPIVLLSFDNSGKVVNARFLRSTGYDNIDGPLMSAFYKWTAEGPLLKHMAKTWNVEVRILLGGE